MSGNDVCGSGVYWIFVLEQWQSQSKGIVCMDLNVIEIKKIFLGPSNASVLQSLLLDISVAGLAHWQLTPLLSTVLGEWHFHRLNTWNDSTSPRSKRRFDPRIVEIILIFSPDWSTWTIYNLVLASLVSVSSCWIHSNRRHTLECYWQRWFSLHPFLPRSHFSFYRSYFRSATPRLRSTLLNIKNTISSATRFGRLWNCSPSIWDGLWAVSPSRQSFDRFISSCGFVGRTGKGNQLPNKPNCEGPNLPNRLSPVCTGEALKAALQRRRPTNLIRMLINV